MGTRGFIVFRVKGKDVAFYNHYDSYPTGLGNEIIKFIRSLDEGDLKRMANNIENLKIFDPEEKAPKDLQDRYSAAGFSKTYEFGATISTGNLADWTCLLYLLREGKILQKILDNTVEHMPNNLHTDYSEWEYHLDFQGRTMTTYHYNEKVHSTRFEDLNEIYAETLENEEMEESDGEDDDEDMEESDGEEEDEDMEESDGEEEDEDMEESDEEENYEDMSAYINNVN